MKEVINRALSFFIEDNNGVGLNGPFIDATSFLARRDKKVEITIRRNFNYIHQDMWNLSTIFQRLEWYRQLVMDNDKQYSNDWMSFAKLDIDHFHIELRSIFDYLAKCIASISAQPGVIRNKSWQQLFNWLKKNKTNEKRLGKDLCPLVRSGEWVLDIIAIRDGLVHFGSETIIFGNPKTEGILFQCYFGENNKPQIDLSAVMFNNNVARFELYSALFSSKLLCFLNDFAIIFIDKIKPDIPGRDSRSYSPGFRVVRKWIEDLNVKVSADCSVDEVDSSN